MEKGVPIDDQMEQTENNYDKKKHNIVYNYCTFRSNTSC